VDDLPDRGGITVLHVFGSVQCACRSPDGDGGQGEDLEEVPIEGNEVFFDQSMAGHEVVLEREAQQRTDFVVAVVGQTVAVRYHDEKDIEQAFVLAQAAPEAIA
jgi:hypothetical protein